MSAKPGNGAAHIGDLAPVDDADVTLTVRTHRADRHIRIDFSKSLQGFTLTREGAEALLTLLESALDHLEESR